MVHTYKVNGMHCGGCAQKIEGALNQLTEVESVAVSLQPPEAKISMRTHVPLADLNRTLKNIGDYSLEEKSNESTTVNPLVRSAPASYFPLILVFAYLAGGVVLRQLYLGSWHWTTMMNNFMGGFFIVFSFFKFLDLRGFASSYRSYDIVTKFWLPYGYIYPFIELGLGLAYLFQFQLFATNLATLLVTAVSSIGVMQSLLRKQQIQCVCLGTVFNLPMSKVTLLEDILMAGMAIAMLVGHGHEL